MVTRHRVGLLSEIPDDIGLRVEIGELNIAVFRQDGTVYAVGDACPHMGASLSEGFLDGRNVVCPWHGWIFDLQTGTSPFDEDARIPIFKVHVEGEEIFIEVDSTAPGRCPSASEDAR